MADATLCTDQQAIDRAGVGISATIAADDLQITEYVEWAEGIMSATAQVDLPVVFSGYSTITKNFLSAICSAGAGMWLTDFDDAGYTSPSRNQTTINILDAEFKRGLALLDKEGVKTFLKIST